MHDAADQTVVCVAQNGTVTIQQSGTVAIWLCQGFSFAQSTGYGEARVLLSGAGVREAHAKRRRSTCFEMQSLTRCTGPQVLAQGRVPENGIWDTTYAMATFSAQAGDTLMVQYVPNEASKHRGSA